MASVAVTFNVDCSCTEHGLDPSTHKQRVLQLALALGWRKVRKSFSSALTRNWELGTPPRQLVEFC